MTYLKTIYKKESSNLAKDSIDDLLTLNQDRDSSSSGFFSNDGTTGFQFSNSKTPYYLISYTIRVWTSGPCLLWSSEYGNLEHTQQPDNTNILSENVANGIIKKWTLTDEGKTWSMLHHRFQGRKVLYNKKTKEHYSKKWGDRRYMRDNRFKLQLQNIDPQTATQDVNYYSIAQFEIEYDHS